jgi:hypothetical protein
VPDRPRADVERPGLQFTRTAADNTANMRTHGFRTHVLLVVAGAIAVLAGLGRPWYARAPKPVPDADLHIGDVNGPLNGLFHGLQRWVTGPAGRTGWDALGVSGEVIGALAGFCAVAALACMLPATQRHVQDLLRYAGLVVIGLVGWRLVDPPGLNHVWELRHGALITAAGALVLGVCAQGVAGAPSRRRVPTPRYIAPPAPPAYERPGSAPPPGL